MKIIIVGGVAGGATAAARLRRIKEDAEIIVFEKGQYISYANCGLPYFIGDYFSNRNDLLLQTPESMFCRYNINVRINSEVVGINTHTKTISVVEKKDGSVSTYDEYYDKLLISTGAIPNFTGISGINIPGIFSVRNINDTDNIKNYLKNNNIKNATIIGGGYVGLEMAEILRSKIKGINIHLIELKNQLLSSLDFDMAAIIENHIEENGVTLHFNTTVVGFDTIRGKRLIKVILQDNKFFETDIVIISSGITPEVSLAKEAGIKIGKLGGIVVNKFMQTSEPDIYAIGDAVEINNLVSGASSLVPLAGVANKQARIAANNIIEGNKYIFKGSVNSSIVKIFDYTAASVGLNSSFLDKMNIKYLASYTHGFSHASYYPKATLLSIKILFSPDNGKLLGVQIVGKEGVDKRIDMLSEVLQHGGSIYDLTEIEQAYSPPYSSAKDPVNIAGFVAENILKQNVKVVYWGDIAEVNKEEDILVDVRSFSEYIKDGGIVCSCKTINIPLDELRYRLDEIPKNKRLIIYCAIGLRGYVASRILVQMGFNNVFNLSGGIKTYAMANSKKRN